MTVQSGAAFLLKIGDGQPVPAYATVAGLRTTQLSIAGDPVAITSKDSGGWRELLSGAGTRSVSVRAGERAVLIDADTVLGWTVPTGAIGASLRVAATGRGDPLPAEAGIAFLGCALLPPAPVALAALPSGDGVRLSWTRRSRAGWSWIDGGDVPLAEQAERYRITLVAAGRDIAIETAASMLTVSGATLAALGRGPWRADVAQIGTWGLSRPATIWFAADPSVAVSSAVGD